MSSKRRKLLVAAIDLGTNYSGYAFSFANEYEKDPTKMNMNCWNSGNIGNISSSYQPTCVLCNPAGQFHSFGYEAEYKYSELSEVKKHHNWYFFRRFKMILHEKPVNMEFKLADEKGLKMKARQVFAMALRYHKDHLLNYIGRGLEVNDVHWVLPVPTTWTVSAKDFLREAANEAGIDGSLLTLVQESKAAAFYSKLFMPDHRSNRTTLDDTKYIVTDLGDERIHTTVLENKLDGAIKVVYTISDRSIGGRKIKEAFIKMIIEIIGAQTFKKFCDENKDDHMEMFRNLECHIRSISANREEKITIMMPTSLRDIYKEKRNSIIQDAIEQSPYRGKIQWTLDKMRLEAGFFRSLFDNTISEITKHLAYVLQRKDAKGITALIMVGKSSECKLLQDKMKNAFPSIKVITPHAAELAVLGGAVIFGHRSTETTREDEDDVSADDMANLSTCSSSYQQGIPHDQTGQLKYESLSEKGDEHLSSDCVEMSMQRQDEDTTALETKLENQMTLKTDVERTPSDDELFIMSRKLDKFKKDWWLLAKLLGLSDEKIDEMEHGGGDSVRQYYKMLTAWKKQNAGQEKGSVRYLLRQCDEAGVDHEVTVSVFRN